MTTSHPESGSSVFVMSPERVRLGGSARVCLGASVFVVGRFGGPTDRRSAARLLAHYRLGDRAVVAALSGLGRDLATIEFGLRSGAIGVRRVPRTDVDLNAEPPIVDLASLAAD